MPDQLDATGLQVKSTTELTSDLTTGYQTIYGSDINVDSNSPDGQLIGIFVQALADLRQLLVQVYNSFSPESATGTVLDQRVALNGLKRLAGSFTTTPILVTATQALTLPGQDQSLVTPFTVADDAGNQFQLQTSFVFSGPAAVTLTFVAVNIGAVQVTANTITNIVNPTLGITSVNNPITAGTVPGVNEETDVALRIRHGRSFRFASTGPSDAVQAALLSAPGVVDAFVSENPTGVVDSDGTPAHSIWCIVTGGTAANIARAIYNKKQPGCGMRGANTFTIIRPAGNTTVMKWDTSIAQPLYIQFQILPKVTGASFDRSALAVQLAAALSYKLGQSPNVVDVITAMQTIAPSGVLIGVGVSADNGLFLPSVDPTDKQHYFTVNPANIVIS